MPSIGRARAPRRCMRWRVCCNVSFADLQIFHIPAFLVWDWRQRLIVIVDDIVTFVSPSPLPHFQLKKNKMEKNLQSFPSDYSAIEALAFALLMHNKSLEPIRHTVLWEGIRTTHKLNIKLSRGVSIRFFGKWKMNKMRKTAVLISNLCTIIHNYFQH